MDQLCLKPQWLHLWEYMYIHVTPTYCKDNETFAKIKCVYTQSIVIRHGVQSTVIVFKECFSATMCAQTTKVNTNIQSSSLKLTQCLHPWIVHRPGLSLPAPCSRTSHIARQQWHKGKKSDDYWLQLFQSVHWNEWKWNHIIIHVMCHTLLYMYM